LLHQSARYVGGPYFFISLDLRHCLHVTERHPFSLRYNADLRVLLFRDCFGSAFVQYMPLLIQGARPRSGPIDGAILHCRSRHENLRKLPRQKPSGRVAPSVLLSALAIFPAGVLPRARDFSSRTSLLVHSRRFEPFLAILSPI
jgi:hypothetical protein